MIQPLKKSQLGTLTFTIESLPNGTFDIIGTDIHGHRALFGNLSDRAAAQKGVAMLRKNLAPRNIAPERPPQRRVGHVSRKAMQMFIAGMDTDRCVHIVETIRTLNYVMHMAVYLFDEIDGTFDGILDPSTLQHYKNAYRSFNALLDAIYASRALGEQSADDYAKIAASADRCIPLINAVANFGTGIATDDFRLAELERTLDRVLPPDVAARFRKENGEHLRDIIRREFEVGGTPQSDFDYPKREGSEEEGGEA